MFRETNANTNKMTAGFASLPTSADLSDYTVLFAAAPPPGSRSLPLPDAALLPFGDPNASTLSSMTFIW